MSDFKPGDRVYVIDAGLQQLREIMHRATGKPPAPNHHGTISDEPWDEPNSVLIIFDAGAGAPYPLSDVRHLPDELSDNSSRSDGGR